MTWASWNSLIGAGTYADNKPVQSQPQDMESYSFAQMFPVVSQP